MRGSATGSAPAVRAGDVVITLVLLCTFVFAYVSARQWPFEARLFPQMLATAGMAFAVLKLTGFGIQARRRRAWLRRLAPAGGAVGEAGEDRATDQDPEYAFGSAGRRTWASALGWVAAFFVSLWLLGVFVTMPLFTATYLKIAGGTSWLAAVTYAGVASGLLWLVFSHFLAVPMPAGIS